MIDDEDRCEWMNVFLVLAHLHCPGQNPESHKMVVCVHACVHVCFCMHVCVCMYVFPVT